MDWRTTVRVKANEFGVSCSTVHGILTEELGMSKVSDRWVPRLLIDKNNEQESRIQCSEMFLSRYDVEGDDFLDRIIKEETWLHYFDPETNAISSVWTPTSPKVHHPRKRQRYRNVSANTCSFSSWIGTGWSCNTEFQMAWLSLHHTFRR